jgi:hypothetical protein
MFNLPKFETEFYGKKFKDIGNGAEYTCIGYGDNQGNPYFVGMNVDASGVIVRTVLVKHALFVP